MWWWENPHASCMSSIDLDINILFSISAGPNHHGTPEHPIKITNGFVRKWTPCDPYRDIPKRIFKYVYIYMYIHKCPGAWFTARAFCHFFKRRRHDHDAHLLVFAAFLKPSSSHFVQKCGQFHWFVFS